MPESVVTIPESIKNVCRGTAGHDQRNRRSRSPEYAPFNGSTMTSSNPRQKRKLPDFLTEGPFIRTFIPKANAEQFIANYIGQMGGEVQYDFLFEKIDSRIIAIKSPHGSVSVLFTDDYDALPDYTKNTRAMYYGDIRGALDAARSAGLKILQEFTKTPGGAQGRIEMAPGYNIEVIEVAPELLRP